MFVRKNKFTLSLTAGLAAAGVFAVNANADEEEAHGDIMPYFDNGTFLTGSYVFDTGTADPTPLTVFEGELEADYESEGMPGGDEPGFATDGSSTTVTDATIDHAFLANTALNFNSLVLPDLNLDAAYWDGTLGGSFVATPHDVILTNEIQSVTLDGDNTLADTATTGFTIWTSDANGVGHGHFDIFLDEADATAAAGIYLISLELEAGAGGATTDPLFFVLNYGLDEELHEAAVDFVSAGDLAAVIPEPASLALILGGGLATLSRRRRA